jgi:hypothetical protein
VVVLGDEPVVERAPVVDLWLKAARRAGAQVVTVGPTGDLKRAPGTAPQVVRDLADPADELGRRLRDAKRAVVIWSGPGGAGGAALAALASEVRCRVLYLPATPNGPAVSEAWALAGEGEPEKLENVGLLLISGDAAAVDPAVRALAERADAVIATAMFADPLREWVDLVLPGTSYLERDGTMANLTGTLQTLRRAVIPPAPDELAWLAKLASRFGVALSPYPGEVIAEFESRRRAVAAEEAPTWPAAPPLQPTSKGGPLRLVRYRPLFAGPEVDRTPELEFQRAAAEIELSPEDAKVRGIETGDAVRVSSNGTSVELRARIEPRLIAGAVRASHEHVHALAGAVEVHRG